MKPHAVPFHAARLSALLFSALLFLGSAGTSQAQPQDGHPPQPHMEGDDDLSVPDFDSGGGEHHGGPGMEGKHRHFGAMLAEKLGLSPEQREKLKALRGDHDEKEKNMLKMRLQRIELKEMLEKGQASDEEILKQAEELSKAMVDQNLQRIKKLLAIRKILTPEQRTKFKEFMEERREARNQENPDGDAGAGGPGGGGFGHGQFRKRFGFGGQP